mgnify:CR=1 FL=1
MSRWWRVVEPGKLQMDYSVTDPGGAVVEKHESRFAAIRAADSWNKANRPETGNPERCESCAHWRPYAGQWEAPYGACTRIGACVNFAKPPIPTNAVIRITLGSDASFRCAPDFGCTMWEQYQAEQGK